MAAQESGVDDTRPTDGNGPAFPVVMELGKFREFVRATRGTDGYSRRPDAVTPPTFLSVFLHWAPPDALPYTRQGLEADRVLHGGREFVFSGPPPKVGARLTAQQRVEKTYTKTGRRGGTMRFVVALTEFRDESGHVVAEMRNTTIETGRPALEEES
ncbi:FAS1-like dehydratase domain-containing protein [Pseudonocardia ailaonensis]